MHEKSVLPETNEDNFQYSINYLQLATVIENVSTHIIPRACPIPTFSIYRYFV